MNNKKFLEKFSETLEVMNKIVIAKNHDYAGDKAFSNFELVEALGITSVGKGILVRMCDKISRISNLIDGELVGLVPEVDEKIEDTLIDLANYSIILAIYLKSKK